MGLGLEHRPFSDCSTTPAVAGVCAVEVVPDTTFAFQKKQRGPLVLPQESAFSSFRCEVEFPWSQVTDRLYLEP